MRYHIKEIVKLPEWQDLRISLIGKWKANPVKCLDKIKEFLGPISLSDSKRLRITHNYLTGSGFRIGMISHYAIDNFLEHIREEVKRRKQEKIWSDNIIGDISK